VASVLVWLIAAAVVAQAPPVDPPSPVRELHATMIKPASDAIFHVAGDAPKSAAAWGAIADAGGTLARAGHLMALQAPARNREKWMAQSRQLTLLGRTAQRAARARRLEALTRASDRVIIVCESCHAPYRITKPT
jgi:hypothetical protein